MFADRLVDAVRRAGSPVCVGLDPVLESLPGPVRAAEPAAAIEAFTRAVLDAVAGVVPAIKPQAACFERHGSAGWAALERLCAHAKQLGLIVVLDAKRGDIGLSARHYAASAASLGADAITVNAYLGPETVEPYLDAGLGVFVLVRTSNPGSDTVQSRRLDDGSTIAEMMADRVRELGHAHTGQHGLSSVGAVVGATKPADARALRQRMPDQVFLVPGYGAQGGTAEDVRPMLRDAQPPETAGVLVTASRSVISAGADEPDWRCRVRAAAEALRNDIASLF